MVFVTLGTQDKQFKRLLEMVDKCIDKGLIKEKVIVQKGITDYQSDNMEMFDFTSDDKMLYYINNASYVISHGGVGTIFNCLKNNKKVIAVPRLSKYLEHHNDHQLQIINEFSNKGYILDGSDLEKAIKNIDDFKPNNYESNNINFISRLEEYINKVN